MGHFAPTRMAKALKHTGIEQPEKGNLHEFFKGSSTRQRVVDVDRITPEFDLPAPASARSSTTAASNKSASSSEAAETTDLCSSGCSYSKFSALASLSDLRANGLFCDLTVVVGDGDEDRCYGHQVALAAANPICWEELTGTATASSSSSSSPSSPSKRRDLHALVELRPPPGTARREVEHFLESLYPTEAAPTKRTRGKVHGASGCRVTLFWEQLNKLRESGSLCDLILTTGGHSFKAHLPMVAAASEVLRDYLLERLEEEHWPASDGDQQEARPLLELSFDEISSPDALSCLLDFLYCKADAAECCRHCASVAILKEVESLARAFDLPDLEEASRQAERKASKAAPVPTLPNTIIDVAPEGTPQDNLSKTKRRRLTPEVAEAKAAPGLRTFLDKNRASAQSQKTNACAKGKAKAVMADSKARDVQREADILCGDVVRLKGLQNRSDLNGKHGHCKAWNVEENRWVVFLYKSELEVNVKPENLEKVPSTPPGELQKVKARRAPGSQISTRPKRTLRK